LDLHLLKYFHAIATQGSMSKAAKLLRVSQPSLTVAMRNLEEDLRTRLLVRDHQGVSLTATGKELLAHAEAVFALTEAARQRITGLESQETGQFVLGCHESLGAYFLPGFMKGFLERAPHIELALWNGTSSLVREAVLTRDVHFGLVVNPDPHPDLVMLPLFKDAMDVVVARSLAPGASTLAQAHALLLHGPLIYAARVSQCQQLLEMLGRQKLLPPRHLKCGDLELVKSLALAGLGVALLPQRVASYGQDGNLIRLHHELPNIPDTICLIYRADIHRTRGTLMVKDELLACGESMSGHVF
jgi:DNA-binding transcriptional LysR family regulator